ncbi:hypothetical protein EON83_16185 [bacterium]|nr:MAG: hypothetical protein EON83_16185 [bacterium]
MAAPFFAEIESAFLEVQKCGAVQLGHYRLAGQTVQMEVVGDELARHMLAPFSHLKTHDQPPALRVCLWDAKQTGVDCPEGLPTEFRSDEWGSVSQSFAYGYERRYVEYRSRAGTTWLDRASNCLYGCYDDAGQFNIYDYSRPLPWLLPIWCNDLGVQSVHAGMVSWKGSGVVIVGASGSGKTTTTLACLDGGFDYLGEDQIGIGENEGGFTGFSFYNTARVDAKHLQRFPQLSPYARHESEQKTLLMLGELFASQLVGEAPLKMIVLPKVMPSEKTRIQPATSAEALRAVAANSLMLPIGGGRRGFERLARLVRQVPCYWLHLGHDFERVSEVIKGALPL